MIDFLLFSLRCLLLMFVAVSLVTAIIILLIFSHVYRTLLLERKLEIIFERRLILEDLPKRIQFMMDAGCDLTKFRLACGEAFEEEMKKPLGLLLKELREARARSDSEP